MYATEDVHVFTFTRTFSTGARQSPQDLDRKADLYKAHSEAYGTQQTSNT